MDSDLESMHKEQLIAEVKKLRAGIREHRDCSGHDLCWYQPDLWSLLPETTGRHVQVPSGRSSCVAASSFVNPWTNKFHKRREPGKILANCLFNPAFKRDRHGQPLFSSFDGLPVLKPACSPL